MAGGGGSQNQSSGPPKWMQNQLIKPALQDARSLYQNAQFFPGQTYAGFDPAQNQALDLTAQRAMAGSPVTRAANQNAADTLGGNFLFGGQGFNAALDAASRRIMPQVDSTFGRSGRLGSGLADVAKTQALSDSFAGLYDNERQRQMQTLGMSPMLANQDYADYGQLANVGAQRQAIQQAGIDESMARYDFPKANMERYMSLLQGGVGMAGNVQSQQLYRNRATGALGGALAGAQLGSMVPGIGTGIGAAGGAILGLL